MGSIDFAGINRAALPRAEALLHEWLPGGDLRGQEYVARNPNRSDKSPGSFKVNIRTFAWGDFATNDSGRGAVSLFAYLNRLRPHQAARKLVDQLGLEASSFGIKFEDNRNCNRSGSKGPPHTEPQWRPVPYRVGGDKEPEPHSTLGEPTVTWPYKNQTSDQILMLACRFDMADSSKAVLPCTLWEGPQGQRSWKWKALPEPRPLYNLDRITGMDPDSLILVVEGEKAAEAAQKIFTDYVVTTSPGGSKAAKKTDWSLLQDRSVYIWPDADQPGQQYAQDVARLAHEAGAVDVRIVDIPPNLPKGWDIADDLPKGWDCYRLEDLLVHARPWEMEPETASLADRFARNAITAGELMNGPQLRLDWTLEGSLLTQTTGLVVGAPGTGKSWFLMQMGAAVATGSPVFLSGTFKPGVKGKVVMVCAEDDKRILQRRLLSIRNAFIDQENTAVNSNPSNILRDLEQNFFLLDVNGEDIRLLETERGNLKKSEAFDSLHTYLCDRDNLALVILDPLSRIHGAEENDNNAGTFLVSLMERICRDTGASVILAHHTRKGKGDSLSPDAGRGASALLGAIRWQLNLATMSKEQMRKDLGINKPEGGYLAGRVSKKNYGHPEEIFYLYRDQSGVLHRHGSFREDEKRHDKKMLERLISIIEADLAAINQKSLHGLTKNTYRKQRMRFLREKHPDLKITGPKIERAIAQALADGRIVESMKRNKNGVQANYLRLPKEVPSKVEVTEVPGEHL